MNNLVNGYPTTNFHELNLDYIITLVRQNGGLHLEASGNQILLKSLDGTTISSITPHYAETAGHADTATSANSATFATSASTASSATTASTAGHALTADSATTAGTATTATSATTAGTATEAVHATTADTALTANTATTATTASYAETTGHVEHADKAIETITISGNTVIFKTYDGTEYTVTIPYAVKALKDSLGNDIKSTYVANVVEDSGVIKFKDAEGNDITSLTPTSVSAVNDSYNNLIADFIKTITVSSNSNYVTITHGTGDTDTILINYSERAYKDTNDNVIKNTYIKSLAMVENDDTGHYNLVAYNGDNPTAEIFRLELIAYRAQIADEATHASSADYATNAGTASEANHATEADTATEDVLGNNITSYAKNVYSNTTTYGIQHLAITDSTGTVIKDVNLFDRSQIVIGFFDKDKTNPDDIDNLTVGQQVTYTVDPNVLSWYKFTGVDEMLTAGVVIGYINTSDQMIQRMLVQYNRQYFISCYDSTANTLKTYMVGQGTLPTDIDVRRMA